MKLGFPAVIGIALCVTSACTQEGADDTDQNGRADALGSSNAAIVNGERLPESVFRLYSLNSVQRNLEQLSEQEREDMLEDLIGLQLLAQEAEKRELTNERRIAAELWLQRLQLTARNMAVRYLDENPATEAELRAAYNENLPEYLSTQYKAKHILLEAEDEAREIIAMLDSGGTFEDLAREHSTGPTGAQGGDLGYFTADSMVAPFAEAVASMEVGSYSAEPVETRYGWHVILLEEVREQQPPGLESVRAELQQQVDQEKLEAFVESLRERAAVEVH